MENKLMFEWVDTTKEQCAEFNRWTQADKLRVKTTTSLKGIENLKTFLHADRDGGLGNYFLQFLMEEPEDFGYVPNSAIDSKLIFKTVMLEGEIIAVLAFNRKVEKGETTMNCMLIAVNPEKQAQGYGAAIALEMVKYPNLIFGIDNCKFTAFIDKDNMPSQKIFISAKFKANNEYFEHLRARKIEPTMIKYFKDVDLETAGEQLSEISERFIFVESSDNPIQTQNSTTTISTPSTTPTTPTDGRKK